ncbi:pyrroline-5-carboxylate reductase [Martensiomyces pterosporus]|nr:pyrroline-5-carboxylate reductase [Martensiomyces pterosporus]
MSIPCITFIGGGNMCEAILSGLLKIGHPTSHVRVSEPFPERQQYLREKYSIDVYADNQDAILGTKGTVSTVPVDVVVLAVKPQVVGSVVRGVSEALLSTTPLVISIVAGVAIADFTRWIHSASSDKRVPLVRLMPNTPALVGEGAAGMYANEDVSEKQREQTEYVVKNIAKEYFWVDSESGIDAVCSISGSGPAYFFLIIEAMEKAGQDLGLSADVAKRLAAQTALGAAKMVLTSEDDVQTLRRKVTSPNGTTHAAIETMKQEGVPEGIEKGVMACRARCTSLSEEFGKL